MVMPSFPRVRSVDQSGDDYIFKDIKFQKGRKISNFRITADNQEMAAKILVIYQKHISSLDRKEWLTLKRSLESGAHSFHVYIDTDWQTEKKGRKDAGDKATIMKPHRNGEGLVPISEEILLDTLTLNLIDRWAQSNFGEDDDKDDRSGIDFRRVKKRASGIDMRSTKSKSRKNRKRSNHSPSSSKKRTSRRKASSSKHRPRGKQPIAPNLQPVPKPRWFGEWLFRKIFF